MKKQKTNIEVKNRKSSYNYDFLEIETAGISLMGSEVKSIKAGNVSIGESHCYIQNGECFINGMYIAEHKESGKNGHNDPYRKRKLLLTKKQIHKWDKELKLKGNTIATVKLFINNKGLVKLNIALARGKRNYDKREAIKAKDIKRDTDRIIKG